MATKMIDQKRLSQMLCLAFETASFPILFVLPILPPPEAANAMMVLMAFVSQKLVNTSPASSIA